ncbi:MAG: biotin transporter BioY, partial [Bacilli bacterium]|nr:biotin transporter BioY [Bacilli bacterium]
MPEERKQSAISPVARITRNAVMLALLCLMGMFSIPLMENVKVSLQLFAVFVICLLSVSWWDGIIVTGCYALIGLFLPIYAGFSSGVSPTFGYILSFLLAGPIIYFMNKIPIKISWLRMGLACLGFLPVAYFIGTLFMMLYMGWDLGTTLLVSVVPYIPFDLAKVVLAVAVVRLLPKTVL